MLPWLGRPEILGPLEDTMHQRRSVRFWNHLVLGLLVLLVSATALCTVASAAVEDRRPDAMSAGNAP